MFPTLSRWVALYLAPVPRPEVQAYTATFVYDRLPTDKRCFRVFHLLSWSDVNDRSGTLVGRLSIVNLDDDNHVAYEALSYVWDGSIEPSPYRQQRPDRVVLQDANGNKQGELPISPALSTALRHLGQRHMQAASSSSNSEPVLPIFIDQLCIDQGMGPESLGEKNRQIGLMDDIYSSSTRVIAWLDVGTKRTDEVFDFIARISGSRFLGELVDEPMRFNAIIQTRLDRLTLQGRSGPAEPSTSETLRQDMEAAAALSDQHVDGFPHRGFLELCRRRWFRRIWIVQEGCLGREMVFVCGRRSCSVRELDMAKIFQMLAKGSGEGRKLTRRLRQERKAEHNAYMASTLPTRILWERANHLMM